MYLKMIYFQLLENIIKMLVVILILFSVASIGAALIGNKVGTVINHWLDSNFNISEQS